MVTPDVSVSAEKLDFGRIIVGHRKVNFHRILIEISAIIPTLFQVMTIQLQNIITLPCEWTVGNPLHKVSKEFTAFSISPWQGWLEPGERVNIHVSFTPNEERRWSYSIPLKIARNPHTHLIVCKGEGAIYNLHFEPAPIKIGPLLPFCTDGVVTSVVNDTDVPAEVNFPGKFSL